MTVVVDARWLLVKTCQDLLSKSKSPDFYDKLRMAGLLRHLLLGPRSLLRLANRDPEVALQFWFREPGEDQVIWTGPTGFDASRRVLTSGVVQRTAQEAFLASRVIYCQQWLSVEQLIATVAHAYGGFLSDVPAGLTHEAIVASDEAIRAGGSGHVAIALQEITGVVLRALIPLANPTGEPRSSARPGPTPAAAAPGCPFSGKLPG